MPDSFASLRGRVGAYESWGRTPDRTARTAPARAALRERFLTQAGGDPLRAEALWRAHFARLALKSAQTRRARRKLAEAEAALAAEIDLSSGDAA